jgi:hypothetical protein
VGAGLGIAGVVLVISFASAILAAGRVPITDLVGDRPRREDLKGRLERNPNLYRPFDSLAAFYAAIAAWWKDQTEAFLAYNDEKATSKDREAAKARFESAGRFLKQFNPLNRRILATAEYENVRTRYDKSLPWIIAGVIVAALGAGMFAYASEPAKEEKQPVPAVANQPARGFLHLNPATAGEFADALGKSCGPRNIPVIALESSATGVEIVTDPSDQMCKVAHLEISEEEGEVTGEPLALPNQ